MKRKYRSGTECEAASIATAQIKTLITSLSRGVLLLDSEIVTEEERTRCRDQRDPAYSIWTRSLIARRDNLSLTISALQEQLVPLESCGSPSIPPDPSCTIKATSRGGQCIYHVDGGYFYGVLKMSGSNKRWFCSEIEAQAAACRRSRR